MAGEADVQVRVVGFDELIAGSLDLAGRIQGSAGDAMRQAAETAAGRARSLTPVDTGRLAGSIVVGSDHQGRAYLEMGVGLPYAGWIEYGGTRGRPYVAQGRAMYPSGLLAVPQAVKAASDQAEREIKGEPWKTPRT